MSDKNLFEEAVFNAYRYPSLKGHLTTEDLIHLPLESKNGFSLNDVAITLDNAIDKASTKNFVTSPATANQHDINKLEIVKTIIARKQRENAARLDANKRKERKARIAEALANLDDKELGEKSREELLKEYNSL